MDVFEELQAALRVIDGGRALQGSPPRATWPIGGGRVTTEEFESWQLGPDLTDPEQREQLIASPRFY